MRLFLFLSISLISLSLNAQNCQKLILEPLINQSTFDDFNDLNSETKNIIKQKIINPFLSFKEFVIFINKDKNKTTAKYKLKESENINKLDIVKNSNYYFYLYSEKKMIFTIDLKTNTALLGGNCVYKITQSLCEN